MAMVPMTPALVPVARFVRVHVTQLAAELQRRRTEGPTADTPLFHEVAGLLAKAGWPHDALLAAQDLVVAEALRTVVEGAPGRPIDHLLDVEAAATPGPWFVHDFSDIGGEVTVSCDHPATLTVADMGPALEDTLDERRANAALIVKARNGLAGMVRQINKLITSNKESAALIRAVKADLEANPDNPAGAVNDALVRIRDHADLPDED